MQVITIQATVQTFEVMFNKLKYA